MNKGKKLSIIPPHVSFRLRYLYQDKGIKGKELLKLYPEFSKTSIYRHAKKPIDSTEVVDKRKFNKGRPKILTIREERKVIRSIPLLRQTVGSYGVKRLRVFAGINKNVCDQTVRNLLKANGYQYLHSRKKGLLKKKDIRQRFSYAKKVRRITNVNIWTRGIAFYLDGVGFQHKYNPLDEARSTKTMAWRRRDEGLEPMCTAKGSRVGSGGRVAHFMVAIAYGKGVILCEQYFGRLNGAKFAQFIRTHFPNTFSASANPTGKIFLQDGCPIQNSKKAKEAMYEVGAKKFSIPPRSPDMNPIENVFNVVKVELERQALDQNITFEDFENYNQNITFENFENFSSRVKETLNTFSVQYINKTINSMDARMKMVIRKKGKRIKY